MSVFDLRGFIGWMRQWPGLSLCKKTMFDSGYSGHELNYNYINHVWDGCLARHLGFSSWFRAQMGMIHLVSHNRTRRSLVLPVPLGTTRITFSHAVDKCGWPRQIVTIWSGKQHSLSFTQLFWPWDIPGRISRMEARLAKHFQVSSISKW